jgi:GH25 family lysozyme M1 (1,4-beta-N-acetylmuramidase)
MTDFGIDVSHWNRVDDWAAVRGNDIGFVSIKLTESTRFTDPAAAAHADGARAAGIHAGGYHFAQNTDLAGQVQHFAQRLAALGLTGPDALAPMLDMEAGSVRARANPFIADFIAGLRAATGVGRVLVYANLDWFRNVLRPVEWLDDDVLLWIARYNGNPGNPGFAHPSLAVHQHTAQGHVPGIPGNVDRNATIGAYTLGDLLIGEPQLGATAARGHRSPGAGAAPPDRRGRAGQPDPR